jgi:hypothetical protein
VKKAGQKEGLAAAYQCSQSNGLIAAEQKSTFFMLRQLYCDKTPVRVNWFKASKISILFREEATG